MLGGDRDCQTREKQVPQGAELTARNGFCKFLRRKGGRPWRYSKGIPEAIGGPTRRDRTKTTLRSRSRSSARASLTPASRATPALGGSSKGKRRARTARPTGPRSEASRRRSRCSLAAGSFLICAARQVSSCFFSRSPPAPLQDSRGRRRSVRELTAARRFCRTAGGSRQPAGTLMSATLHWQ